ncbi:hypothetical protein ACFYNO_19845 [Kitasatospora sp. NPDC006697]|uniref:hypothetical protein n=1 Tax=Kitasatospora sp. NPDC006697 TaxID=3364020 RepID=UPI0036C72CF4
MTYQPPCPRRPPGRLGAGPATVLCLVAFLTAGLLGFLPAVLLAVRRRTRADLAGAVAAVVLELALVVSAAITDPGSNGGVANHLGVGLMLLMMLGAPLHFLLMNRRAAWDAHTPAMKPAPMPTPYLPPPAPADDLQQLAELPRRQAGSDRR